MTKKPTKTTQTALPLAWEPRGVSTVANHPVPNHSTAMDRWVGRICAAIAEIAAGDRPPQQMFRIVHPRVLTRLKVVAQTHKKANSPIRRVLSVRVRHNSPTRIEACAVVEGGRRCQAVAIQLTKRPQGWIVTAAEIR